jgi:hypothetical protein
LLEERDGDDGLGADGDGLVVPKLEGEHANIVAVDVSLGFEAVAGDEFDFEP